MPKFKRGDRVQYIGGIVASLHKEKGTVKRYGRNGWCIVDFDNGNLAAKIDDNNLIATRKGN